MKNTILLILISLLITSCGNGTVDSSIETLIAEGNLEAIISKKQEITEKQKILTAELRQLVSFIKIKDSNYKLALVTAIKTEEK